MGAGWPRAVTHPLATHVRSQRLQQSPKNWVEFGDEQKGRVVLRRDKIWLVVRPRVSGKPMELMAGELVFNPKKQLYDEILKCLKS